ncbi:PASTA domain-containing protein [Mycobacterium sp. 2YAF39]|uniref:PASTA domain-containing protein n=1 Tax=Mycobacterium sp. 2YAF39 TaxID=3233033 RepID=UPI003F98935D
MKKLIVLGAGPVVATAAAAAVLFGAGTASAAPDVVGQTYSDAKTAIEDDGGSAVIASRFGDKLDEGDCIVTNAYDASFLRDGADDGGQVNVVLNCDGAYATAKNPGASVASPLGGAAKSEAEKQAAEEEQQSLEEVSTPDE